MVEDKKILNALRTASALATGIDKDVDEGTLNQLSSILADLHDDLREAVQGQTRDEMTAIIKDLENGAELSPDALDLIRTWMVSDAEFYVQMENDFANWVAEVRRIFGRIEELGSGSMNPMSMGQISGSIRDALRVIADINFFRREEQRIQRFEQATQTLDSDDRKMLADLLRDKMMSSEH